MRSQNFVFIFAKCSNGYIDKISKKMEEKNKSEINLPPHGCITEIAKLTGYSRTTVRRALRNNTQGSKSENVRQIFRSKYM